MDDGSGGGEKDILILYTEYIKKIRKRTLRNSKSMEHGRNTEQLKTEQEVTL